MVTTQCSIRFFDQKKKKPWFFSVSEIEKEAEEEFCEEICEEEREKRVHKKIKWERERESTTMFD